MIGVQSRSGKKTTVWAATLALAALAFAPVSPAWAHHGGVSAAFGPGAPIETSSPLTLQKGKFLIFERVELSPFRTFGDARDVGGNKQFNFTNTLFGYGLRNDLSLYVSLPYAVKKLVNDRTSRGFGDLNIILQYGFKYGERDGLKGWYSFDKDDVQGKEYTLTDWKFGISLSTTIPSGEIGNTDKNGAPLSVGAQTGFAVPSYNFTGIVSKMLKAHWTWNADIQFRTFALNGGPGGGKPGNEFRLNNALMFELFEKKGALLSRIDLVGEVNYLKLRRDLNPDRTPITNTGGNILYLSPGVRLTMFDKASIGLLYKEVAWRDLNQESQQQGGEGLEDYRFIATFSMGLN